MSNKSDAELVREIAVGPEVTVRMETRDEAERLWLSPLFPGWKVVG
jgi:hypothetical protein